MIPNKRTITAKKTLIVSEGGKEESLNLSNTAQNRQATTNPLQFLFIGELSTLPIFSILIMTWEISYFF